MATVPKSVLWLPTVRRRRENRLVDVIEVDLNRHDRRLSKSHSFGHRIRGMCLSSSALGGQHPQTVAMCRANRLGLNDPWPPAIANFAASEFLDRRDINPFQGYVSVCRLYASSAKVQVVKVRPLSRQSRCYGTRSASKVTPRSRSELEIYRSM